MLDWLRRVAQEINWVDHELVRRSADVPPSPVDDALKGLTRAANQPAVVGRGRSAGIGRRLNQNDALQVYRPER